MGKTHAAGAGIFDAGRRPTWLARLSLLVAARPLGRAGGLLRAGKADPDRHIFRGHGNCLNN
jgi:hypothetical protein